MNAIVEDIDGLNRLLLGEHQLQSSPLCLQLQGYRLRVRSNSARLLRRLAHYFHHVTVPDCDHARAELVVIDRDPVDTAIEFKDWKREPGKTGRKDAIHDFAGGRLVRKVRTGMVFLQSDASLVAAGPCLDYDNQVVNFINSQFLNWWQNEGYRLCHAAALSRNGRGLAVAGLSGGGKSTLMLNLLEDDSTRYVTNDRLLVSRQGESVHAIGIPKLPRINPGTIVNNPRLHPLIDAVTRAGLLQMEKSALWQLEQKYDVNISELYGSNRIKHETELRNFLVLNWRHGDAKQTDVARVDLKERPDLLAAIMKPSGPFYLDASGRFNMDDNMPAADAYLDVLAGVAIYEASGAVDFERVGAFCRGELLT